MKNYYFIYESPHVISYDNIEIIQEQELPNSNFKKLKFKAELQKSSELNGNKRRYSIDILNDIVNQLKQPASKRALYMELDHPFVVSDNTNIVKKRAVIVEIKTACALLTDIELQGDRVIGIVETLSNRYGQDLYNIIKYDKAQIGFSLRALGSLKPLPDGTFDVIRPIKAVTYDVVSNPSHKEATIIEFLTENVNEFNFDTAVLEEGLNTLPEIERETVTICDGNVCIQRFLDDVIEEQLAEKLSKFELRI